MILCLFFSDILLFFFLCEVARLQFTFTEGVMMNKETKQLSWIIINICISSQHYDRMFWVINCLSLKANFNDTIFKIQRTCVMHSLAPFKVNLTSHRILPHSFWSTLKIAYGILILTVFSLFFWRGWSRWSWWSSLLFAHFGIGHWTRTPTKKNSRNKI
jgi:hypothetical protein